MASRILNTTTIPNAFKILERITDAIVAIDNNWCYSYMNKRAGEILNCDPQQMIGKNIWTEFPQSFDQPLQLAYERAMKEQEYCYLEKYYPSNDRWFENHIYPSQEGLTIFFRDITERKRTEQEFPVSKQNFAILLEKMPAAVALSNHEDGRILEVNDGFVKTFGYSSEEVIGKTFNELRLYNDPELRMKLSEQLKKEGMLDNIEINMKVKSGEIRRLLMNVSVLILGGEKCNLSIIQDITEKKKAEEQLLTSEEKYRTLTESQEAERIKSGEIFRLMAENMSDMVAQHSPEGIYLYVSPSAEKILGYKHEELIGVNPYSIMHPDDIERVRKVLHQTVLSGVTGQVHEYRLKHKNGKYVWMESSATPLFGKGPGEVTKVQSITRDISERKKAEEEIKQSREKYISLIQTIEGIVWEADAATFQFTYVSPYAEKLLGYPASQWTDINGFWTDHIHPEDRTGAANYCQECTMNKQNHEFEYRMIAADARIVWIRDLVSVVIENDKPAKLRGIMVDITEHKLAEEKIILSQHKLQQTLDNMLEGVLIIGFDYRYIYLNEQAMKTSGFNRTDLIGRTMMERFPGVENTEVFKAITRCLEERMVEQLETYFTFPHGLSGWFQVSIQPVEEGAFVLFIDITGRKKEEADKMKALERYDILAQATSDTIWDWDILNNKMQYNHGITKMFGYNLNEISNVPEWWKKNIHPEDIERVNEKISLAFEKQNQITQMEYRYRCLDETYKYILDRAYIMYDKKNNPVRMIGAMQDVTYQKEEDSRLGKVMISAQERERQQVGMELHDNVNQILSASLIYLGMATDNLKKNQEKATELLQVCNGLINDSITELRRLSHQLAPASFENVSLTEVVSALLQNMNSDNKWTIHLDFEQIKNACVSPDIKVNIYRILQEQLNNIVKYAHATEIVISAELIENLIVLHIADNGVGFQPSLVKMGIGLENIKRRALLFSGDLVIDSAPGNGCKLTICLPLENKFESPVQKNNTKAFPEN